MKIIFDFRKFDTVIGGVEQGVIQIAKVLTDCGHSIIILCKKNRIEPVTEIFKSYSNLKIISLNTTSHSMSSHNANLDSTEIQNIAESENADIIHFFYNWSFPAKKKVPCILTIHDVIPFTFREAMGFFQNRLFYKPGIRKACELNDRIATVSEYSKQDIAKKVGVPLSKITVVPNGLREPYPEDKKLENELRKKFNIDDQFVLNVGGIHERKNIVRLIYVFRDYCSKTDYNGKLLITGSASGAPYQNRMRKVIDKAIAKTNLFDSVVFTGFISENELDSLFRIADFLVYPSLYEGFGIPILEAMKLQLPVITSNVTGMPEVASDGALLVDPTDVNELCRAMITLSTDKELKKDLIKKGTVIADSYTWFEVAKKYLTLYESAIADFVK